MVHHQRHWSSSPRDELIAYVQKTIDEPPLEGLWWADDLQDFICANRDKLNWRMMIVYEPDWLTAEMLDKAIATAAARLGEPPPACGLSVIPKV